MIGLVVFVLPFLLIAGLMAIVVVNKARKSKRMFPRIVVADVERDGSVKVTEEYL